jgi:two-component system chemotaxis sensor kinase CheA
MEGLIKQVSDSLDRIAMHLVTLEEGNIPAMGLLLSDLSVFEKEADALGNLTVSRICGGLRSYLGRLVLGTVTDLNPLEEGVSMLQEMLRCLAVKEPPRSDSKPLLEKLVEPETTEAVGHREVASREDIETLRDFVVESFDNLNRIELNLLDLEQDPQNRETIHSIFRAFHTIKGVSGFLNLQKINRLSHATENLLDSVREGEVRINDRITDVILESVDTFKRLIDCVELAIASGGTDFEGHVAVDSLIENIEEVLRHEKSENRRLGEMLVEEGLLDEGNLQRGLESQKGEPEKRLGSILVDQKLAKTKDVIRALRDQKQGGRSSDFQVKVDTLKLDSLVDLTGELVISHSMLRQSSVLATITDHPFIRNLGRITQIVSSLQKTAMSLRMVPIRGTFQKMLRLIRDLAKNSGKSIRLEMSGEETEIDRNLVEELYEPLVHMVRNSVDHGIEAPEERKAAGKPEQGTVRLRAYHSGGHIVIEISDDGRGIDRQRVLQKAFAAGLVKKGVDLTEAEIFNLIFQPGLSTAAEITDLSGRGVGMDVVKRRIEKLRGRIGIHSVSGQGCRLIITLPLTLAIIDGMLVRVGQERYIIPTLSIVESFQPERKDYHTVHGRGELIMARGSLIPLIRLDRLFRVKSGLSSPWEGLVAVVENNGQRAGLLLDELLGQEEIVIKSLGETMKGIEGIAGGAILGDGRIGLILDVAGLLDRSRSE